jgi:hypothetical protein
MIDFFLNITFKLQTSVNGISERIDDIFFKESMTKLSLYKIEVRLQKLEDFTHEAINQMNTIVNLLKLNDKSGEVSDSKSSARSRNREDSGGLSSENQSFRRPPILRENSRSSINKLSSIPLMPPTSNEFNVSLINRRRKHLLSGEATAASLGEHANNSTTRRSSFKKRSEKISDHDDENEPKDPEESKYLRKITKKIMSKKPMKDDDTFSSSSTGSDDRKKESKQQRKSRIKIRVEDFEVTTQEKTKPVKFLGDDIKEKSQKRERKISFTVPEKKSERSDSSSSSSSSYSDTKTTRKMLKEIYRNQLDEQQHYLSLAASQAAYTLDQYTIHPFVYLHSVVKPPLAEYTSITDCIDTSNIDRPPSPSMSLSKSNVFFAGSKSSSGSASQPVLQQQHKQQQSKISSSGTVPVCSDHQSKLNDFAVGVESTRSIVARQESEILRLVEESQHVIISQMLTKIVSQNYEATPMSSSSPDANSTSNNSNLAPKNELDESRLTDEASLGQQEVNPNGSSTAPAVNFYLN